MSLITIPNTFSAGAVIIASQHNSNFSTIYSDYNGNIDNSNISGTAAIAYSKLNLTGAILSADLAGSVAYSKLSLTGAILNTDLAGSIADSKLSQITTASKVSGTAITGLASLPSGAGVIPDANLPTRTFKFISKTTLTAATNSGDIAITNTKYYKVTFHIGNFTGVDGLAVLFNNDTGSNYKYVFSGGDSTGAIAGGSASAAAITLGATCASATDNYMDGYFYIFPQAGTTKIQITGEVVYIDGITSRICVASIAGYWTNSAAATSFRVIVSPNGNSASGDINLYQIQQS